MVAHTQEVETGGCQGIQDPRQAHRELKAKIHELFSQNKTTSNNNDKSKKRNKTWGKMRKTMGRSKEQIAMTS